MKNKNKMHESLIGKIIYGFLMFMPLLSILTSCLYVVFNPNAKDSYSGTSTQYIPVNYQTNEVNSLSDLIDGNLYMLKWDVTNGTTNVITVIGDAKTMQFVNLGFRYNYETMPIPNKIIIRTTKTSNTIATFYITPTDSANAYYMCGAVEQMEYKLYFIYKNDGTIEQNALTYIFEADEDAPINNYEEIQTTNLDNAFDYAIQNTENNPLYNWTTQTGTYQIIELTTTTLQIDNSFVNLLLTYWLLITIIYIIYDIALIMVLLVHRKVHELIDR